MTIGPLAAKNMDGRGVRVIVGDRVKGETELHISEKVKVEE